MAAAGTLIKNLVGTFASDRNGDTLTYSVRAAASRVSSRQCSWSHGTMRMSGSVSAASWLVFHPVPSCLSQILYGNDEMLFSVAAAGDLRTVAAVPGSLQLDFERRTSYKLVVQAKDPGGLSCFAEVAVAVDNVNEVRALSD
jgi:hypothetical protein